MQNKTNSLYLLGFSVLAIFVVNQFLYKNPLANITMTGLVVGFLIGLGFAVYFMPSPALPAAKRTRRAAKRSRRKRR